MKAIPITRTPEAEKSFNLHIKKLQEKYPQITDFLSTEAVPILLEEGIKIQQDIYSNIPYYIMDTEDFAYEGAKKHYVIYTGADIKKMERKDFSEQDEKNFRRVVNRELVVFANDFAKQNFMNNYAVVVKDLGTFDIPHVHLIEYTLEDEKKD